MEISYSICFLFLEFYKKDLKKTFKYDTIMVDLIE